MLKTYVIIIDKKNMHHVFNGEVDQIQIQDNKITLFIERPDEVKRIIFNKVENLYIQIQ